ncbi:hypothetical protein BDF21DRAFT_407930 [Thamnidium elegans]|nr:hypothetical protein BDF21DRAFT_407930 [Thamnidium elegans]
MTLSVLNIQTLTLKIGEREDIFHVVRISPFIYIYNFPSFKNQVLNRRVQCNCWHTRTYPYMYLSFFFIELFKIIIIVFFFSAYSSDLTKINGRLPKNKWC